jgi:hypothetical protein
MAHISSTDFRQPFERASSRLSAFQNLDSQLIRCDVVFGIPSQDCRGTGICKISSDVLALRHSNADCRRTAAFVGRGRGSDKVVLVFLRELLCTNLFRRHFRKGVFEMPEACPIPAELGSKLRLSGHFLLPGRYAISEKSGCFCVEISCGA